MACDKFTNLKSWCLLTVGFRLCWTLILCPHPLWTDSHPLWTDSQPGTDVYLHFPLELVRLQSSNHRFLRRNERTKGAQRWRSSHDAPMDPVFSLFSPRATKISSRQRRRTHDICLRLIETEGCLGDWDVPSVLRAGWLQWGKSWDEWRWKWEKEKQDVGVGRLPAVSNRIMEIRETSVGVPFIWPPICFKSFEIRPWAASRGKKVLRADQPSSDQHLGVIKLRPVVADGPFIITSWGRSKQSNKQNGICSFGPRLHHPWSSKEEILHLVDTFRFSTGIRIQECLS